MNRRSLSQLALPLLLGAAAGPLPAATPAPAAPFYQETNDRIEDLFRYRTNPPKPPGPQDNPFRIGDASLAGGHQPAGPASSATSDEDRLRDAAGGLVFGGLLEAGGVQVLVINKASYREGGILTVRQSGGLLYLRLVSITSNSVTLGLNEARLTLHF
jgi:hypothetical protein